MLGIQQGLKLAFIIALVVAVLDFLCWPPPKKLEAAE
jgi:hypothetical protein